MALISTGAAAIAGVTAATAYVEAKYHIGRDVQAILHLKRLERQVLHDIKSKRICLWYKFEEQAKRLGAYPDLDCLWSRTGVYTWNQTYEQSCRYAQFFIQQGVKPAELVAFYLTNSPEFIFSLLGTWAAGSGPAMINYNLANDALIHCLKVSGAKLMIVDEDHECRARIEEVRDRIEQELGIRILILDRALKDTINSLYPTRPDDSLRADMDPKFPMALLYTSGSTGHPKACSFEMQRANGLGNLHLRALGLKSGPGGDRYYDCMPFYHGTGCTQLVSCLTGGMTLCIGKKFSTSQFWNDVRDSDATLFVYVGETARYLLNTPPGPLDKKHRVHTVFGNGMRPDVWLRFQERFGIRTIAEFFNSTEGMFSLVNKCSGEYRATAVGSHGALLRLLLRNTYAPVEIDPETEAVARDPSTGWGIRNSYDQGGEMLVKLPNKEAFVGYYKNESATNKKFETDLFQKGDVWYRTGDALRRNSDGQWYFMDRLGDTFRWKSENVSTQEVAEAIGHYPGVFEAMVYGVLVPGHDGRAGCAAIYIDPAQRKSFDFKALHAYLHDKLPKYAVPVFLRLMAKLNPMHNQKPNKVPYKKAGIDLDKIAADSKEGEEADELLWCPRALGVKKSKQDQPYVKFEKEDSQSLQSKASKL